MNALACLFPAPNLIAISDLRLRLWDEKGYRPVAISAPDSYPAKTAGKRPVGAKWQTRARYEVPQAAEVFATYEAPNTGILADGLQVIDIDVDDAATAAALEQLAIATFGPTITRRRGNSPRSLLVYRAAEGEPRKRAVSAKSNKVEVLGRGQQFVSYGWHASGAELVWPQGGPADVRRNDLPPVTEPQVEAFLEQAKALLGPEAEMSRVDPDIDRKISNQGLVAENRADVAAALMATPNSGPLNWDDWSIKGMSYFNATEGEDYETFRAWSALNPGFDERETEDRWDHWHVSPADRLGAGTIYFQLREIYPNWIKPSDEPTFGLEFDALPPEIIPGYRLIYPDDCTIDNGRDYLIKRLLARGDVGAIVGQPGCGKSIIAPHIAYALAQGRPVFGLRTRQGRALYVAAEDSAGMKQRVHALRKCHGTTPNFAMVEIGNLTNEPEVARLRATVAGFNPDVIFIDTIGAAWPGMEENSSEGMGQVVKLARGLAVGRAVLLICHPAKNSDGSVRGHSSMNGTLDMCLGLAPKDTGGVIRCKLSKNRNGTTEHDMAFRFVVDVLGEDQDGDEITAPRAVEVSKPAVPAIKLTPPEAGVLEVLRKMAAERGQPKVSEAAWRERCDDERAASTAELMASRKRVFRRAYDDVKEKGLVAASGGMVWLTTGRTNVPLHPVRVTNSADLCSMEPQPVRS